MDFRNLVEIVASEPVFDTGMLLAGRLDPRHVRRQLSRWTKAGRLYQLRRGLYSLAPPFQKIKPHPFLIANRITAGSYVSCQSAMAYYGLIPEYVPITTSVTTGRPSHRETELGSYEFRHLKTELFFGYRRLDVGTGQEVFIASPEKALLDLIYLQPGGDSPDYLKELRLQSLDILNLNELQHLTERSGKLKLLRASVLLAKMLPIDALEYQTL
ncbi:hypothetical protein ES703_63383 [subsurface metagenome]